MTALEDAWRDEWGRLLALLVARYRRLDLAEDGLGDAFEAAARTWPADGVPANPAGWLLTAARNRIQTSLNLAMGSAMASIGLTIPSIAVASLFMPGTLLLGLGSSQIVLLALTIVAAVLTVLPGRATRLQGGVHLVIFAAFIVLSVSP